MNVNKLKNLTVAEYLALEKAWDTKYEYHDGQVVAMADEIGEHRLISGNAYAEMKFGLRKSNSDYIAMNDDVKLYIESSNKYLYPDAAVVYGELERIDNYTDSINNPTVVIEVLSKSTESYDRGDKFFIYQKIDSVKEYILINQYKPEADIFVRQQSGSWDINRIEGLDKQLEIGSLGLSISMKDIYYKVVF